MGQGYYDDARYRTLQMLPTAAFGLLKTASLAGTTTAASTLGYPLKMIHPVRVVSASGYFVVGGTNAIVSLVLSKSAAGTGTASTIGTMAVGTSAAATHKAFTVTETSLSAGDTLLLQRALGTHADVTDVMVTVGLRETFE